MTRHGEPCTAPDEDTFLCGVVQVTLPSFYEIQDVLDDCESAGAVLEVIEPATYVLAVPVGHEVALRDCYAAQPRVSAADFIYVGSIGPSTALRAEPINWLQIGGWVLVTCAGVGSACCAARTRAPEV
jgi:hypothetical protein